MDPNEYQRLALRTECEQTRALARLACLPMSRTADYTESQLLGIRLLHGAVGISKEGGELLAVYEKWIHYGKHYAPTELRDKVRDEGGDVLWYLNLILSAVGLTLQEVMEANVRKLATRYPDRYTDEAADDANRDREAEALALAGKIQEEAPPGVPAQVFADKEPGAALAGSGAAEAQLRAGYTLIGVDPAEGKDQSVRATFDDKGRLTAHVSHTWREPDRAQTRCTVCGAYRHLGSGIWPCESGKESPTPPGVNVCKHCRGAGEVTDEWSTVPTPCPICEPELTAALAMAKKNHCLMGQHSYGAFTCQPVRCMVCGKEPPADYKGFVAALGEAPPPTIALKPERVCPTCRGDGHHPMAEHPCTAETVKQSPCPECKGKGTAPPRPPCGHGQHRWGTTGVAGESVCKNCGARALETI